MRKRHAFAGIGLCVGFPLAGLIAAGCGSAAPTPSEVDDKFAARTNDETIEAPQLMKVIVPRLGAPSSDAGFFDAGPSDAGPPPRFDAGPPPPPFDAGPPPPPFDAGPPPPPFDAGDFDGGDIFDAGGEGGGPGLPDGGGPTGQPSGFWHFDDCSPTSPFLADSSGNGANAQHRLKSSCVQGVSGQGVDFKSVKDIVQIADEPQFTMTDKIAAAAWVNPRSVSGDQPIVLKRLDSKTAFSLGIHNGEVVFSIVLKSGKTVTSSAPISANVWSHVAGFYDGHFVFLFLDGQQVGQVDEPGTLRDVIAPVRIGATTQTQHFDGVIDEVFVSTNVVTGADIAALACIQRPPTMTIASPAGGAVQPGVTVDYGVSLTDNDIGACQPAQYFFSIGAGGGFGGGPDGGAGTSNSGIQSTVNPQFTTAQPGQTVNFDVSVTATEDATPGSHQIPFSIFPFPGNEIDGSLDFELAQETGCHVSTGRELMITDPSIVDDPVRTAFNAPGNPSQGVWTFGRIMRDMAPTPEGAPAMVEALFDSWLTDQSANGFTVSARPAIQQLVLDAWPRTADGKLDLDRSPLRLLAIVNRMDVRDLSKGNAGEGRFVFGVLDGGGNPQQFTVIVEYGLPASTEADVLGWASAWHALGSQTLPSEGYNAALEALTLRFSGRGAAPGKPNGSALDQLRTNEIALVPRWEMRQFGLSATTGGLQEETIDLTPDLSFNGTSTLAQFVNANEASIIAETDTVPAQLGGSPFLAASVFNDLVNWTAPGINNNEARFHLSLNTCNGCHGPETNTGFLHISPRSPGQAAALSSFLTGTTVTDPVTGAPRTLNDLSRRNGDLKSLVCAPGTTPTVADGKANATITGPQPTIRKGIGRVH